MEKLTKRKAFNFLRSYFDVLNELPNNDDKLSFLLAIINKQFLDEDPKDLKFLVKLCYQSQKHSIESSVKGWKRASNTDLLGNPLTPLRTNPLSNPATPKQEEEEKEEVQEKGKEKQQQKADDVDLISTTDKLKNIDVVYYEFVKEIKEGKHQQWAEQTYMQLKLKKGSLTTLINNFKSHLIRIDESHETVREFKKHLNNWLNNADRIGNLKEFKLKSVGAL